MDSDGVIWIGDGPTHEIVAFDESGSVLRRFDLSSEVIGIGDVETAGTAVVVLDIAALTPKIIVVDSESGAIQAVVDLPAAASLSNGLSGIDVESNGTVVAELEGGSSFIPVARINPGNGLTAVGGDAHSAFRSAVGDVSITRTHPAIDHTAETAPANSATVAVGNSRHLVTVSNALGTVRRVGQTPDAAFIEVQELSQTTDGEILVDSTVRAIDTRGQQVSSTRIPQGAPGMRGASEPAITTSGAIIVAVPEDDRVDILRLSPVAGDEPAAILPSLDVAKDALSNTVQATSSSCIYSRNMNSNANRYTSNSHYLSSTNITGSCSGRTTPRYLGSAGTYSSVPYEWGGFDSVAGFNSVMSPNTGRAGNINSNYVLSCSYGVDCSGFVSRVWGLGTKYGTSTLPNISYAVSISNARVGDIFNRSGYHVVMYRSTSGGGYYIAEATTSSSYDRVIARWVSTSYVSGYSFRRYNNWCCDPLTELCPQ